MSVIYRGKKPTRNYPVKDFLSKGISIYILAKWYHYENKKPLLRVIFRSNGLLGEIRSCYDGKTWAVDIRWGRRTDQQKCLTTECKTLKEGKSILYLWFESKGFLIPKQETDNDWSKGYLSYPIGN